MKKLIFLLLLTSCRVEAPEYVIKQEAEPCWIYVPSDCIYISTTLSKKIGNHHFTVKSWYDFVLIHQVDSVAKQMCEEAKKLKLFLETFEPQCN